MQNAPVSRFTLARVDRMIAERFARDYDITTWVDYLDHLDRRTTAHLPDGMADRIHRTAGEQRRKAKLRAEGDSIIIAIPMNAPRAGKTIWAELFLTTWLNVIECGADGAWFFAYKSKESAHGQVRVNVPLSCGVKTTNATIARIIVNAKVGQRARVLDRNPLNLRTGNLYVVGNPATPEGKAGIAKTVTRAHVREQLALRARLARRGGDDAA